MIILRPSNIIWGLDGWDKEHLPFHIKHHGSGDQLLTCEAGVLSQNRGPNGSWSGEEISNEKVKTCRTHRKYRNDRIKITNQKLVCRSKNAFVMSNMCEDFTVVMQCPRQQKGSACQVSRRSGAEDGVQQRELTDVAEEVYATPLHRD